MTFTFAGFDCSNIHQDNHIDWNDDVFSHQVARRPLQPEEQGEGGRPRWGGVKPPFQDSHADVMLMLMTMVTMMTVNAI